jgi:hypothetical protein
MTFSEAVTSVTRSYIVPKVYDTISKGSPVLMKLLQNAKPWKTGVSYDVIIKYQDSTNGGNTGIADKLDTDRQNVRTTMSFQPKMAYKPVVIANIEQLLTKEMSRLLTCSKQNLIHRHSHLCKSWLTTCGQELDPETHGILSTMLLMTVQTFLHTEDFLEQHTQL